MGTSRAASGGEVKTLLEEARRLGWTITPARAGYRLTHPAAGRLRLPERLHTGGRSLANYRARIRRASTWKGTPAP